MSNLPVIEIITPSALTTIQDLGRRGWMAYGVPPGGPMDGFAHRAANQLAGNPPDAAVIELGHSSAEFLTHTDCLIAATGPGFALYINQKRMRSWTSIYVRKNGRIRLEKLDSGNWGYLALHGGIQTAPMLGSRSSYPAARLGAAPLAPGDQLTLGPSNAFLPGLASRTVSSTPAYSAHPEIYVIPGPQQNGLTRASLRAFYTSDYRITTTSDRTGYRLSGPPLERATPAELVSEGMARGCIQIPPDGQPIVMQADCPTTGGYPKIAAVITADQPVLAQVPIGTGTIRFVETTIEQAQVRYRTMIAALAQNIIQPELENYL